MGRCEGAGAAAAVTLAACAAEEGALVAEAADLGALLGARGYVYTLFHKALGGEPSDALVAALAGPETAEVLGAYAEESAAMAGVRGFLAGLGQRDGAALACEAKDEYTRLFVGPGAPEALPWESPYVSKRGFVCQESALAVRQAYRAHGLEPRRLARVPDDHVSLICAFAAACAAEAQQAAAAGDAAALAAGLREQGAFVREHLASWPDDYARAARRSKTAVLYPQLIEALAEFVRIDAVFLDEAAFWAEGCGRQLPAAAAKAAADAAAPVAQATATLAQLRLFGLEDNELAAAA